MSYATSNRQRTSHILVQISGENEVAQVFRDAANELSGYLRQASIRSAAVAPITIDIRIESWLVRAFESEDAVHQFEVEFVRAFIAGHRQERWLESLASKDRRVGFLDKLNHCRDFDDRFVTEIRLSDADLISTLVEKGAPKNCYVLSDSDSLDGREMPLTDAVSDAANSGWGTIIICIAGRLAFYYDECGARKMILSRGPRPK